MLTTGIAVEQAQVYGRLIKSKDTVGGILPKSPEVLLDGDKQHFVLSDGAVGRRYELSGAVAEGGEWKEVVDVRRVALGALADGQTACILGLGIGYL